MIQLPQNLDIEVLVYKYPPDFKFKIDNFKYLISLVSESSLWNKDLLKQTKNPFINLHSKLLQPVVRDYQYYLRYLVETGILETDDNYIVGSKSKGYRLKEIYCCLPKEDIIKDQKVSNRIQIFNETRNEPAKIQYGHLTRWFNDKLNIDNERAYEKLELLYQKQTSSGNKANVKKAIRQYTSYKYMIDRISNHNFYSVVDESGHRLHTILTTLKKDFRQFLTYDNQQLVSIDLSCSQPFLSTCLFNRHFFEPIADDHRLTIYHLAKNAVQSIEPIINQIIDLLIRLQYNNNTLTLNDRGPILPMFAKNENALSNYIQQVQSGQFYEYLQGSIKEATGKKNISRGVIKQICLTILFSDPADTRTYFRLQRDNFRKIFPEVYELFSLIKLVNYKTLSILLQNIESELILNRITKRIGDEKPDLPIFTIHDSVCTTIGHEEYVQSIMGEELYSAIGINPHFKCEYWTNN